MQPDPAERLISVLDDDLPPSGAVPVEAADFAAFFASEYRSVVALSVVLVGDRAVAEEIAQDAFCAAFRRWGRVQTLDNPGAWVRRVATNLATSSWRRRVREARALARLRGRRSVDVPEPMLEDAALWRELRALPRRQAQCLALRYVEDLSTSDIAEVLGVAEATVRVHLHHGRLELARRLGEDAP